MTEVKPSMDVWRRLERELGLARYRIPWHRRAGIWKGLATAATAALVIALAVPFLASRPTEPQVFQIAALTGKDPALQVIAHMSKDGRTLVLHAPRPMIAGPTQSYELWLIPTEGGNPLSLAVLGTLDAQLSVPAAHVGRLRRGAKLAITPEPAGGSPTGKATGPVILVGEINA